MISLLYSYKLYRSKSFLIFAGKGYAWHRLISIYEDLTKVLRSEISGSIICLYENYKKELVIYIYIFRGELNNLTDSFEVRTGLKQDDGLASTLCNVALVYAARAMDTNRTLLIKPAQL